MPNPRRFLKRLIRSLLVMSSGSQIGRRNWFLWNQWMGIATAINSGSMRKRPYCCGLRRSMLTIRPWSSLSFQSSLLGHKPLRSQAGKRRCKSRFIRLQSLSRSCNFRRRVGFLPVINWCPHCLRALAVIGCIRLFTPMDWEAFQFSLS